jgi:energy-coupling factor transporter ATP-binding protein EcfA2
VTTLVYVHGTNGSGKSTLARAVLAAAGGAQGVSKLLSSPKATWTHTGRAGVVLAGKYGTACGGVDGFQPYADLHQVLQEQVAFGRNVFAEGLVTPGQDTCVKFASYFDHAVFILLDTPDTVCIKNVLKRRATKGTTKPYDPKNLYRKQASAKSWAVRLERAGLNVQRLQYRQAYTTALELLGLPEPSVDDLLS